MTEQPAAPEQPAVPDPAQEAPGPVTQPDPAPAPETPDTPQPVQSASNESPVLPPSAQAGAAKAHAILTHLETVIGAAKTDIERFVPASMLSAAQAEVTALIRGIL